MSGRDEAVVELVEQAMMSGYLAIRDRLSIARAEQLASGGASGADILRDALDGYAAEFCEIRRGLVDAVLASDGAGS